MVYFIVYLFLLPAHTCYFYFLGAAVFWGTASDGADNRTRRHAVRLRISKLKFNSFFQKDPALIYFVK
ncbi:hypothetical protein GJA_668 [Janthinobacterium agaricidamnosum NBRC 102515 = DSM 9628]|uniref:Uncharacterized protein n=1 Tax=Janthinobacterium agaricidamnosum NBRC 102515 = DSM 9628 TaxID=1349767 RepID=W0V226_9BURK|nr:hypothetical protein GJA_668 [Janthinobacterium agaricidamnosum NBRC 102515 = DSM 9628]